MDTREFLAKHRIILIEREIDLVEVKRLGREVYHDGVLCGYYIEDGFYTYSAYCSASRGNFKNAFRIANVVSFLNPSESSEVLFKYMDLLCKEYFDTGDFYVDRSIILNNINKVKEGLYKVSPIVSKYFWVNPYTNIGLNSKVVEGVEYAGKKTVVMSQFNKTKKIETMNKIQNGIDVLTSELHVSGSFLTMKDIANFCGVSRATIDKYYIHFKEEIDNYNLRVFDTSVYGTFLKSCSIDKITYSIKKFIDELEIKISQRKIAKKSGLHFNTVCKLWNEDDVQDALEEYNNWLKQYNNK